MSFSCHFAACRFGGHIECMRTVRRMHMRDVMCGVLVSPFMQRAAFRLRLLFRLQGGLAGGGHGATPSANVRRVSAEVGL
jgi:hypothetical protein